MASPAEPVIVQAPMAGGPSTPALATAVGRAGGLGFLAAGYLAPEKLAEQLDAMEDVPYGVNVFSPVPGPADAARVAAYADALRAAGAEPGEPRFDDDAYADKLALLIERAPAVVSFTFGCPQSRAVRALQAAGTRVWVTVTTAAEARAAAATGADAVVAQGAEAGGHRGGFADDPGAEPLGLLPLLQLVRAAVEIPVVAAGGIATAGAVAAVLALGASAAAAGTAFLCCPEAGTGAAHRAQIGTDRPTGLTRAWSGRQARGIVNAFQAAHPDAPAAYPELHHLTGPMRAAAREAGDAERVNLWAGQAHPLTWAAGAAAVVAALTPA